MAAPIAHIFLAVQMLAGPLKHFNEKEFIIGTSFPDIRYLNVIKRTQTHFENVKLADILKEKNSFKAGMLFHSFVDEQREKFIVEHKFYDKLPHFKFTSQSLKFAEDEILKSLFDISKYQSYFENILEDEKTFGIESDQIKNWHNFLQEYFKGHYTLKNLIMKYYDMHEPNSWAIKRWFFSFIYSRKIEKTISIILNSKESVDLILKFYLNFQKLITKF